MEIEKKKAKHYWEFAAVNGSVKARHNIGVMEGQDGAHQRSMKHFILAARAGYKDSLNVVKGGFMNGHITKEEYSNTLRAYQKSQDETNSEARDKARALHEMFG